MRPEEERAAYWAALYELWRLSWYQIDHHHYDNSTAPSNQHQHHHNGDASECCTTMQRISPQPVMLSDWLKAIDHGDIYVKAKEFEDTFGINMMEFISVRNNASSTSSASSSSEPWGGTDSAPSTLKPVNQTTLEECDQWYRQASHQLRNARLGAAQLTQIAGALIKTGMAGSRFRTMFTNKQSTRKRKVTITVYYIDPACAVNLQRFINSGGIIDPLRPGYEGCADHLHALLAQDKRPPSPQIVQFDHTILIRHVSRALSSLRQTIRFADHDVRNAREQYPI